MSANKTNGNNVNIFGPDTSECYLTSPSKKNRKSGRNEFDAQVSLFTTDPAPPLKAPNPDSLGLKSKALVGNCPIKFDMSVKNKEVP